MKQAGRGRQMQQEISNVGSVYGHDAYLCVCGVIDESGAPLFKESDIKDLNKKNGAVVGRIALAILDFSGMGEDAAVARGEKTEEQAVADELKN